MRPLLIAAPVVVAAIATSRTASNSVSHVMRMVVPTQETTLSAGLTMTGSGTRSNAMHGKHDRLLDLMRQGFMKPIKQRKPKAERPIVACHACLNWHPQGKHTASAEQRKANLQNGAPK
jgi:hypothetical protein